MLHFPVLLLYLIMRSRFQVKHATLLIPIDLFLVVWWRSFTLPGKVYPIPKWLLFLNLCGEWFFTAAATISAYNGYNGYNGG